MYKKQIRKFRKNRPNNSLIRKQSYLNQYVVDPGFIRYTTTYMPLVLQIIILSLFFRDNMMVKIGYLIFNKD